METFKVGDEVEVTEGCGWFYQAGARGNVIDVCEKSAWVKFHTGKFLLPFGCMGGWIASLGKLRHVQPAAPAVTSRAVVLDMDGVEYTASFNFVGDWTTVMLLSRQDGKIRAFGGNARRNPHDEYNAETGMRVAMKRACGIGEPHARQLPAVYRAFRKWQHEQAAPAKRPLAVGDEVVAVKDDYSGGEYFRKGARGKIVSINDATRTGQKYIVMFTEGIFKRGYGPWAARADEIEAA